MWLLQRMLAPAPRLQPRSTSPGGRNELHTIFDRHFPDFCEQYDEKYAAKYGMFRLERIQQIGERFATCGDYLQGITRVRCTNQVAWASNERSE